MARAWVRVRSSSIRRRLPRPVRVSVSDQAGAQGERIDGLDEVVVGARLHPVENLVVVSQHRDHHHVDVAVVAELTSDPSAQLGALDPRHHPVGEQDVDLLGDQDLPRGRPVGGHVALMAQLGGYGEQFEPAGDVVVRDEDVHLRYPGRRRTCRRPRPARAPEREPPRHGCARPTWPQKEPDRLDGADR